MIPNDIIYLISEYNHHIEDSIILSLINKEIYNNCDKIILHNPIITNKNYKTIIKYKFNDFSDNTCWGIDKNLFCQKKNRYYITDVNIDNLIKNIIKVPINIKEIHIYLSKNIGGAMNLKNLNASSIVIHKLGNNKIIYPKKITHLTTIEFRYHTLSNYDESINLPNGLTHFSANHFNQPINLPDTLTHISFGSSFNQQINLPNSLTHLTFGKEFSQPINLPNSLTHLTFGHSFNQPINLPNSLTHLTFGHYYNQPINLPNSLTHLTFGHSFNQPINLPNSLTHITFGCEFNQSIILPNSLTHLTFGREFNQPITLPNSLTYLVFGHNFNQPITLPNKLTHLTFEEYSDFNQSIVLPNSLIYLFFGNNFNKSISLPNNLEYVKFGNNFDLPIDLPNSLVCVKFGKNYNQIINLIDKQTRKTFKNLKSVSLPVTFRNKLRIGIVEGKNKIKIKLNRDYIDRIFSIRMGRSYDFKNYIITDLNGEIIKYPS